MSFANDILLKSDTVKHSQKLLFIVERKCEKVGLMIIFLNMEVEKLKTRLKR